MQMIGRSCDLPDVNPCNLKPVLIIWVNVKELSLSYYSGVTILITIYIYPLW